MGFNEAALVTVKENYCRSYFCGMRIKTSRVR